MVHRAWTRTQWGRLAVAACLSVVVGGCARKAIEEGTCTDADDDNFALCIAAGCSAYKSNDATGMDSCDGSIDVLSQAGSGACSFSGSGACEIVCECGEDVDDGGGGAGSSDGGSSGGGSSSGGSTSAMCDDICDDLWPCIWGDTHASVDCSTCDTWNDPLIECLHDCGTSCGCAESDCGMTVLGG